MVAACGNGEKSNRATAAPTTEVMTATPTTTAPTTTASASSDAKTSHLEYSAVMDIEDVGYINVQGGWYTAAKTSDLLRYSSPDKYTVLLLRSF